MLLIKKRIECLRGLFNIGQVAENDFMLRFVPKGKIGVVCGKKHFRSVDEAESYILILDVNGFLKSDL